MRQVATKRSVSSLESLENSKKGVAIVLVIAVIVILASFIIYFQMHKDDAFLSATLFYRYSDGNATSGPNVRVWGSVLNWGDSSGSGTLTIVIEDDEAHRLVDHFKVGPVPAGGGISVDKTYQWDHLYDPVEHPVAPVEVTYNI